MLSGTSTTSSTSQVSPIQSKVSSALGSASSAAAGSSSDSVHSSHAGPIAGGVVSHINFVRDCQPLRLAQVGGAALILLGILLLLFLRRRRGQKIAATRRVISLGQYAADLILFCRAAAQAPFDIDEYQEAPAMDTVTLTPYADNPSAAYASELDGEICGELFLADLLQMRPV